MLVITDVQIIATAPSQYLQQSSELPSSSNGAMSHVTNSKYPIWPSPFLSSSLKSSSQNAPGYELIDEFNFFITVSSSFLAIVPLPFTSCARNCSFMSSVILSSCGSEYQCATAAC